MDDLERLLAALDAGETIPAGSPLHAAMLAASQRALRITGALNAGYHEPAAVRDLLAELTGRPVHDTVTLFPPLSADMGLRIRIGAGVFINAGCRFQDQGGIEIGDRCLIGHGVVLATLDHGLEPERRGDLHPAPIVLGRDVWIGANAVVTRGVTIGDGAVVAAGAVVTRDVPPRTVVGGVPARVLRTIEA